MAHTIPLIRSAVLFPMLHWLRANGRPAQALLESVDIGYVSLAAPETPIPLVAMLAFFRAMAAAEGPDIAARVISTSSFADFGAFGQAVLGAPTPRAALQRCAGALRQYSTHELLALEPITHGLRLDAGWSLVLDEQAMLLAQQFTAALVHMLCRATVHGEAGIGRIAIAPHPVLGIEHLRPWLGNALVATCRPTVAIDLDDDLLDAPLQFDAPQCALGMRGDAPDQDFGSLLGDSSFRHSVKLLITAMIVHSPVTIGRIARVAGMSSRSVQRALLEEGTSFRALSDDVRRQRALNALPLAKGSLSHVAHGVGYAAQSSLSRAVRRWTGAAPRTLRVTSQAV